MYMVVGCLDDGVPVLFYLNGMLKLSQAFVILFKWLSAKAALIGVVRRLFTAWASRVLSSTVIVHP
jgi:hypothetical protein